MIMFCTIFSIDEYGDDFNLEETNLEINEGQFEHGYLRRKRFYPVHVNVGCIKGATCCADLNCRPFCSLCYGKWQWRGEFLGWST